MARLKRWGKRLAAGLIALLMSVSALGVPRARAVTGVDDVTMGITAILVHLKSIGTEIAVAQGTSLAASNAVASLATQAGAAGAFGAGVTGASALAAIGASCVAFAGGFSIGYAGYQTLSQFAEWLRQARLTGAAPNRVYSHGGSYETLLDGSDVVQGQNQVYVYGDVYQTQAGSSWWVSDTGEVDDDGDKIYEMVTISSDNVVQILQDSPFRSDYDDRYGISTAGPQSVTLNLRGNYGARFTGDFIRVFVAPDDAADEREEVTMMPPVSWAPPVLTSPDQVVEYRPYPNDPDMSIQDIIADVPESIYDGTFNPSAPTIGDGSDEPGPDDPDTPVQPVIPPIDPNPGGSESSPTETKPYEVSLGMVFPFCIPFDVYHMVTMFVAEPEAPNGRWEFSLPWDPESEYVVEWDLEDFDELAELLRKLELVAFAVGLAVITRRMIKW